MANNSIAGMIGKSILLLLLIVILIIGGILWFDFLGVIDRGDSLNFITNLVGIDEETPVVDEESNIYLLDAVRLVKEREAIERREIALKSREEGITLEEAKNRQVLEELKEKEAAIIDKEKSLEEALNRYNDEQKNLETTVSYLAALPPQSVVDILNNYPVLKVVDTLRKEDEIALRDGRVSNSSTWILFMDAKKAAEVQDMMIKKPS
ncbi:hypothetical protein EW093_03110 [Thiospirochaeta perfilievii]|uniref:Flagellar protein FlbB n=1 Tax=Thiospirochaeta perfilievii TaxID=252967 RepID=A0A5C1Q9Z1_9SPIO|nr:hypothetical protein [Thiospirochaeta perfilievii]QEN03729.1 hypothetical protein EW093_03110 [Thiospirochaeta perfilievii]